MAQLGMQLSTLFDYSYYHYYHYYYYHHDYHSIGKFSFWFLFDAKLTLLVS